MMGAGFFRRENRAKNVFRSATYSRRGHIIRVNSILPRVRVGVWLGLAIAITVTLTLVLALGDMHAVCFNNAATTVHERVFGALKGAVFGVVFCCYLIGRVPLITIDLCCVQCPLHRLYDKWTVASGQCS